MTNEERQRAYRERHLEITERINITLNATSTRRLERLARYYGIKQRDLLGKILADAENRIAESGASSPTT